MFVSLLDFLLYNFILLTNLDASLRSACRVPPWFSVVPHFGSVAQLRLYMGKNRVDVSRCDCISITNNKKKVFLLRRSYIFVEKWINLSPLFDSGRNRITLLKLSVAIKMLSCLNIFDKMFSLSLILITCKHRHEYQFCQQRLYLQ